MTTPIFTTAPASPEPPAAGMPERAMTDATAPAGAPTGGVPDRETAVDRASLIAAIQQYLDAVGIHPAELVS